MRKLSVVFLLLTCISLKTFAQETDEEMPQPATSGLLLPTQIGNFLVGANLLFTNATFQNGYDPVYKLGLQPKTAIFVLPNIALGLNLDFSVEGNKIYRNISYGFSPFVRIYFANNNVKKPAHPLLFFMEAGVGYGGTNNRYTSSTGITDLSSNGVRVHAMPGVNYFINERVAVELGLEYLYIGGGPDAHRLGLSLGFQIFLSRNKIR